jgi:HlyD family secretion protein
VTVAVAFRRVEGARPSSGAAMDRPVPNERRKLWKLLLIAGAIAGAAVFIWLSIPRGLVVTRGDIRTALVEDAMFRNDVLVRSTVTPLRTVMLDALESGRVEEILVLDGALVQKGDLLFRLSNPQLRLELVAREADRAQQISNISMLKVALESSETEHERRMLDLKMTVAQAERQQGRFVTLVREGAISRATFEDSQDRLERDRQAFADERTRAAVELRIKHDGIAQMQQAIARLDAGLAVVNESIEGLAVRAPIAGRLTDFRLEVGEIIKPDQRIGRIDDPGRFKLVAQIEEYFLGRVAPGKRGNARVNERDYPIEVSRVFPQIKDGRFAADLLFTGEAPRDLKPGQSLETRVTLGETSRAVTLPNDAFLNDGGGSWVFVVSQDGLTAERRNIRTGRRNNSQVEIASGLKPGESVIVSGYTAFGNATRLRIVP